MYSGAADPFIDFLIRVVPDGRVSTTLSKLDVGDEVQVNGPYGDFCIEESLLKSRKFIFIASGTGIAPFHSFYLTFPEMDFELLHGVRFQSEVYDYLDYPEGRYFSYISRPEIKDSGMYVTHGLRNREVNPNEIFYICGNRQMIVDSISILREKGIHGDAIFTETFF